MWLHDGVQCCNAGSANAALAIDKMLLQQQHILKNNTCAFCLQVKLRNVMASVSDMLGAHGFALGMQQHVPDVLQRHLDNLARKARQQLLHGSAAEGPVASNAHQVNTTLDMHDMDFVSRCVCAEGAGRICSTDRCGLIWSQPS